MWVNTGLRICWHNAFDKLNFILIVITSNARSTWVRTVQGSMHIIFRYKFRSALITSPKYTWFIHGEKYFKLYRQLQHKRDYQSIIVIVFIIVKVHRNRNLSYRHFGCILFDPVVLLRDQKWTSFSTPKFRSLNSPFPSFLSVYLSAANSATLHTKHLFLS